MPDLRELLAEMERSPLQGVGSMATVLVGGEWTLFERLDYAADCRECGARIEWSRWRPARPGPKPRGPELSLCASCCWVQFRTGEAQRRLLRPPERAQSRRDSRAHPRSQARSS